MNIASQLRHFLTFLAGLGGLFLSWQIIAPDQVAAVDKAGADLIDPLIIIIGAVAAGVMRLAISWIGSFISRGAGEKTGETLPAWAVMIGTIGATAVIFGSLPSCSSAEWPVSVGIEGDGYRADYSSKGGLAIRATVTDRRYSRSSK